MPGRCHFVILYAQVYSSGLVIDVRMILQVSGVVMFGLFRQKPLLDPEAAEWQFDCFAWLLRNSGGFPRFRRTVLILPTERFFPQRGERGQAMAEAVFQQVKIHAGMQNWPCLLKQQEQDLTLEFAPTLALQDAPASPAGTFTATDLPVITYNPKELAEPLSFIATMAHELAHYFTGGFREEPPGGWDNWEFATDLTSVFLGFGLFSANSCFSFSQFTSVHSQGWQSQRHGYLSEPELLHALAIFSTLLEIPHQQILPHLKPSLRGRYKQACKEMQAHSQRIAALQTIIPAPAIPRTMEWTGVGLMADP